MLKKLLPLVLLPLLMAGCAGTFTNLTPKQQARTSNNLYTVEVAFNSRQQALRWDSIKPQIVVGSEYYDMHPTSLMTNRWEGTIPVPQGTSVVRYHYQFDYRRNSFGGPPEPGTESSGEFTLRITEP
jgi:hypothetical protein